MYIYWNMVKVQPALFVLIRSLVLKNFTYEILEDSGTRERLDRPFIFFYSLQSFQSAGNQMVQVMYHAIATNCILV